MEERIHGTGHENVTARHDSTLEVTTDDWLTPSGDCIVGVAADQAPSDFDQAFVDVCRSFDAEIRITLAAGGHRTTVTARGSPDLTFGSERSAVVRTSRYVDDRTIAVGANAAAGDLDRTLIDGLTRGVDLVVTIAVDRIGQV